MSQGNLDEGAGGLHGAFPHPSWDGFFLSLSLFLSDSLALSRSFSCFLSLSFGVSRSHTQRYVKPIFELGDGN